MARALVRLKYSPSPAWRQAFQLRVLAVLAAATCDDTPAQPPRASSALCAGSYGGQGWAVVAADAYDNSSSKGNAEVHVAGEAAACETGAAPSQGRHRHDHSAPTMRTTGPAAPGEAGPGTGAEAVLTPARVGAAPAAAAKYVSLGSTATPRGTAYDSRVRHETEVLLRALRTFGMQSSSAMS